MDVTIAEGFALLALKDESGEKQGQFVEYGLAGSALSELILRGKIAQDEDKPKRFHIVDAEPTGDRFLDFCLAVLLKAGSGKSISTYVTKLASKSKLFKEQALSLVEKGVLSTDEKSFLVFSWTHYPAADAVTAARAVVAAHGVTKANANPCDNAGVRSSLLFTVCYWHR